MLQLVCPECSEERPFEQPACVDGHGVDCPEWACTECGFAIILATYPEVELSTTTPDALPRPHAA